jgi:hypothetical protein
MELVRLWLPRHYQQYTEKEKELRPHQRSRKLSQDGSLWGEQRVQAAVLSPNVSYPPHPHTHTHTSTYRQPRGTTTEFTGAGCTVRGAWLFVAYTTSTSNTPCCRYIRLVALNQLHSALKCGSGGVMCMLICVRAVFLGVCVCVRVRACVRCRWGQWGVQTHCQPDPSRDLRGYRPEGSMRVSA